MGQERQRRQTREQDQREDDDNDALYLVDVPLEDGEPLESHITTSVFALGEDDAIDQNGARVNIHRSWITGFAHEGVAASNGAMRSLVSQCRP